MSLRFVDGFDHYALADITQKWTASSLVVTAAMSSGVTRFGVGQSFLVNSGTNALSSLTKTLDAQGTWIVGLAVRFTPLPAATVDWVQFNDGANNQVSFRVTTSGQVAAYRNATLLGTSVATISAAVWHYVEFKVVISATVGVAACSLDGVSILNLTSQNTKAQTNATANSIVVGILNTPSVAMAINFDDLYICDGSGSVNNDFLGDVRVQTLYPSGAGATGAFASSAGGANYLNVDEAQGNGDTDYNSSATVGQTDTYGYTDIPTTNTVKGVQVNVVARKDDAGTRTLAPVIRHSGTDYAGVAQAATSGYTDLLQVYEQNPGTSAAWAAADVNAAEFGCKVVS